MNKIYPQVFESGFDAYRFISEEWLMIENFEETFMNDIARAHTVDELLSELGFETIRVSEGIDENAPIEIVS